MNETPVQSADVRTQQLGQETLLLDRQGATVHVLNPTAYAIWQRCDGRHTPADIANRLRDQFAISAEHDPLQDVTQTLALLRRKGLLH